MSSGDAFGEASLLLKQRRQASGNNQCLILASLDFIQWFANNSTGCNVLRRPFLNQARFR